MIDSEPRCKEAVPPLRRLPLQVYPWDLLRTTVFGPRCSKDKEAPPLLRRVLLVYLWAATRLPTTASGPKCNKGPAVVLPLPPLQLRRELLWVAQPMTAFERRCKEAELLLPHRQPRV
jgi:hypothetical protein